MLAGALLLTLLPTAVCIGVFQFMGQHMLLKEKGRESQTLVDSIAHTLSGRINDKWKRQNGELVDSLSRDPRVGFIVITDQKGKMIHAGIFDNDAWGNFQKSGTLDTSKKTAAIRAMEPQQLTGSTLIYTSIVKYKQAEAHSITNIKNGTDTATSFSITNASASKISNAPKPGSFEGTVILAMNNPVIGTMAEKMYAILGITAGVVFLIAIPGMMAFMHHWRKPIVQLVRATQDLANGNLTRQLHVGTQDEFSFLAESFNEMTNKINSSRKALILANEELDEKVKQRTQQLEDAIKKLDEIASTDSLTGLANRRAFTEGFDGLFERSNMDDTELACIIVDLDGFKPVNDTLGHKTGDELLVLAASVLKENSRETDMVARLGGDEFVILMPNTEQEQAAEISRRILAKFCQEAHDMIVDPEVAQKVSFSMGMALRKAFTPDTAEDLLHQADQALYDAKAQGKARLNVFTETIAA
jgi:diguanylate cyclase (GGDEF)-like protein